MNKMRHLSAFVEVIGRLNLLHARLHRMAALVFLAGELTVVITMLIGGRLLVWGFLLAVLMLLAFCVALVSALLRRIQTPCNCFGVSKRPISPYDVVRNAVLIAGALGGYCMAVVSQCKFSALSTLDWGLAGAIAAVFMVVLVQLKEIVWIFRYHP
jgi:hypothetical protein